MEPPLPHALIQRDLEQRPRSAGGPSAPSFGLAEQRRLTRTIADLLVARAPADRDQIRVLYRAAGSQEEVVGHVLDIDGRLRPWQPPAELAPSCRQLRAGMHEADVGTWTAAATVVEYPIRTSIEYRTDGGWRTPPPRHAVLDELELFPRDPEHVPAWMASVLPNAARVAEATRRFRRARIFDSRDPDGRPVVDRPPVPAAEVQDLLSYLTTAPTVITGRGFDPDVFDPDGAADVPCAHLTDGTWLWTAAIPHYLAKHGVPPEPDLVAHARRAGFTPPPLSGETTGAAFTALTGELPAPTPQPRGSAPPTGAPVSMARLSDGDRTLLELLRRRMSEAGVVPQGYRIISSTEAALCLERSGEGWQVAYCERGAPRNTVRFERLWDAGAYLLGSLTLVPSAMRAGGGDRNSAPALNDWPIQPLTGEPPLTLLAGKHIAVLAAGREVVRYGPDDGNLAFAAQTEFPAMSLRADRQQKGPHRYRVERDLRTLSGRTVPWHDQPGGGIAYLLARSVSDHRADGSLTELTGEGA